MVARNALIGPCKDRRRCGEVEEYVREKKKKQRKRKTIKIDLDVFFSCVILLFLLRLFTWTTLAYIERLFRNGPVVCDGRRVRSTNVCDTS